MNTFKIKTLGCKVNQCESEGISNSMTALGLQLSDNLDNADIIVVNTCAVTQKAAMQSRQTIRQAIKDNTNAKLIVTGCYAKIYPKEISEIENVDFIASRACKYEIAKKVLFNNANEHLKSLNLKVLLQNDSFPSKFYTYNNYKKTRPFLKIQDGCNSFCTYCIIPYARGKSKSLAEKRVLKKIKNLKKKGYKEIVLTGINIGTYGRDLPYETNLYILLRKMIRNKCIDRIRISSIEPKELSDEIIQLVQDTKKKPNHICHHFHIPLQSGDNSILKRMHRPYDNRYFNKLIEKILLIIPNCTIGIDVLVGFPGENETAFNNTYNLIKKLKVSYLHVFPFSARKGTPAWNYPNKVNSKIIKERCKKIRKLGTQKQQNFHHNFLGKTVSILVENQRDRFTKNLKGFSEHYIPVQFEGPDSMRNTIQKIKINKISETGFIEGSL